MKICDLEQHEQTIKVEKPQFALETYVCAKIKEGADDLTLRADEEALAFTFFGTKEINIEECGPSLANEDWHAICQVLYQSIETEEWYNMYETFELNRELHIKGQGKKMKAV